jgi:tetratricopeptide (TPR) repeat protein
MTRPRLRRHPDAALRCRVAVAVALAFAFAFAPPSLPAVAQGTTPRVEVDESLEQEARILFEAGRTAYRASRFDAALEYFQRAYELSRRPLLLHNIALTQERLQRNETALATYRRFLGEIGEDYERGPIERRIAFLERLIREQRADAASEDRGEDVAAASSSGGATVDADAPSNRDAGSRAAPWIVVGVGGALAAGGVGLLVAALLENRTLDDAPPNASWADYAGNADRADLFGILGWIGVGVGVAVATAGVVWAIVGSGDGGDDVSVSLIPMLGGLALTGSFR